MPDTSGQFKAASSLEKGVDAEIDYKGIVIGSAYVIDNSLQEPQCVTHPSSITIEAARNLAIQQEEEKFREACERTVQTYVHRFERFDQLPIESRLVAKGMQEVEEMAVNDAEFRNMVVKKIKKGTAAETALYETLKGSIEMLRSMEDEKMAALANIMEEVAVTTLQHMGPGQPASIEDAPPYSVPAFHSLPVGALPYYYSDDEQTLRIHGTLVRAGTKQDHGRIVARSSGITVAKIDEKTNIKTGDLVIIDGPGQKVIVNPAAATIEKYKALSDSLHQQEGELASKSRNSQLVKTRNGELVKVCANIGFSNEILQARNVGAAGVGLIRTELPFIQGDFMPNAAQWKQIFTDMRQKAGSTPWTLRVVDFDGDKKKKGMTNEIIESIIREQISMALEVKKENPDTKLQIMIPTVSTLEYFHRLKDFYQTQAKEILGEDRTKWPKFGCMVENQAIIKKLDKLGADFLSIGSNDLIANTLGFDRYDPVHAKEYDPTDPAIIETLEKIMKYDSDNCPVSICGDMASDPRYIGILLGSGLRSLSAGVNMVPKVKEIVSRIDTNEAKAMIERLTTQESRAMREKILDEFNRSIGLEPDGKLDMRWRPPEQNSAPQPT